jgi:hypothetical protein
MKIFKNPWLLVIPFLILTMCFVLANPTNGKYFDEDQYLSLAKYLTQGYYSPPGGGKILQVGPGYPLLLMPFVALKLPLICITIFQTLLFSLSVVLLFKSLESITSSKIVLFFSLFWATNINMYEFLIIIYTETFAAFLIVLLIYCLLKAFRENSPIISNKYVWFAGISFGFLVLTKIIFGYILLFMLAGILILLLFDRLNINYRKGAAILILSFITVTPYLIYTYNLTGRVLYWGTSAGTNLYWMSSPYKNEYGDYFWLENPNLTLPADAMSPAALDSLRAHHQHDFDAIKNMNELEKDKYYREVTISNIKAHPGKYMINLVSNMGRMIYNSPYSYKFQNPKNMLRLPHNGLIILLSVFSLFLTIRNWRTVFFPLKIILFLLFFYLGLSLLGSADSRMFSVIVPFLIIWNAYIIEKSVSVRFSFK